MLILMPPCAPDMAHAERLLFLAFWCVLQSGLDVIVVGMAGSGLAAEVEPAAS